MSDEIKNVGSVNETYSWNDSTGTIRLTAKREFLQLTPEPEKFNAMEIFTKTEVLKYLHNTNGPAIEHLRIPKTEKIPNSFFLNGKPLLDEEIEKLIHNADFNNGFNTIIKSE